MLRSETHSLALFLASSAYVQPSAAALYLADRHVAPLSINETETRDRHHIMEAFIRLRAFGGMFFPEALR